MIPTGPDSDRRRGRALRVAIVGYSFMGTIHAQAWTTAPRFFDLGDGVDLVAVSGRDAVAARAFADRFDIGDVETDWRSLPNRGDIDVIDICTPDTCTRRSPSPPSTPASTCSARSRWPTP